MKFSYKGVEEASNQVVEGELDAVSQQEAMRVLAERRIEVFQLQQAQQYAQKGRKVKTADLVLPLQELATLTSSGVTLIDAIKALSNNDEHPQMAKGFAVIASHIESGESFSAAIVESGLPFPVYVGHLVSAGELGGELAQALQKAAQQLEYEQSVKGDMRSALTYPLVLIGSGIAAMLIIFFAVVPKFSHMLDDGKELPALAWAVLSAGKTVNQSPLLVATVIAAALLTIIAIFLNQSVQRKLMDTAIEMPVIGPWLAEQDAARWASLCAAMLLARVNLVSALRLAAQSCEFSKRRKRADTMVLDVESGVSFTEALTRSQLVPETSLNLVAVGDKTGQLADMLNAVAKLHDTACKRRMKQVLTLMEPIAILIVGIMIGVMILGIVLAITASTDIAI
ncbi:type II secretion system F family protein [Neiella sp. HB171785]|uniref:Type II secretion system F family protein n=1 Tax=Neiella litorisoli TaxID=2771431 RepID=A0A8J6UM32_9GAMM|nr:type II secretion system F family protein [Neiella litorisoli]MBD1389805.1 type II secretion system F family protein [Neiella litorisoli]